MRLVSGNEDVGISVNGKNSKGLGCLRNMDYEL